MQRLLVAALVFASGTFGLAGCLTDVDGTPGTDDISKAKPPGPPNAGPNTFYDGKAPKKDEPFFASLGTNGRSCGTCHVGTEGWSMTPDDIQARFDATDGTDPVFRTNDGTVSPNADVSTTAARRIAYAMLLSRADIRVGIGIPSNAEFTLSNVDDPYGYASATELSLFRRPLPSANLKFLSAVMWDGREASLGSQAIDATMGHAKATGTVQSQMDDIVAFEQSIYCAVKKDPVAGDLDAAQVHGGPQQLASTSFYIGINDPIGQNPMGTPFDPNALTMFATWATNTKPGPADLKRAQIARGEAIFNTHAISITGVKGLNDTLGVTEVQGTCSTCHDTPNVGDHSVAMALDIGISDASQRTPDMPLYTLRNKATGATLQTTDPGRALITGKWADIGKFKGPVLRSVSLHAPYFHNGSAASLDDVLDFYEGRFGLGLTVQERADLVAFLQAL
jgi:cytochrome c peroxidase